MGDVWMLPFLAVALSVSICVNSGVARVNRWMEEQAAVQGAQEAQETAPEQQEEPSPHSWRRDDVPLSESVQDALWAACSEYGVPYELALGLIETESGFVTTADNGMCYGLCQLSRYYFPSGLSPEENVRAGMQFLGSCYAKYGDWGTALTVYNAGHDTGSRRYAQHVFSRARAWGWNG